MDFFNLARIIENVPKDYVNLIVDIVIYMYIHVSVEIVNNFCQSLTGHVRQIFRYLRDFLF